MPAVTTENIKSLLAILIPAIAAASYIVGINARQDGDIKEVKSVVNEIRYNTIHEIKEDIKLLKNKHSK